LSYGPMFYRSATIVIPPQSCQRFLKLFRGICHRHRQFCGCRMKRVCPAWHSRNVGPDATNPVSRKSG